jgi:uncharacterized membrane protein YdfJ with MMPL/SSD domain
MSARITPLLGSKVWFAPHRIGWGLGPASVEGWLATAAAMLAGRFTRRWPKRSVKRNLPSLALVAIALLKGAAPGGRRAHSAYRQARSQR